MIERLCVRCRTPPWLLFTALLLAVVVSCTLASAPREIKSTTTSDTQDTVAHPHVLKHDVVPIEYELHIQPFLEEGYSKGFINISFMSTDIMNNYFFVNALGLDVFNEKIFDPIIQAPILIEKKSPQPQTEHIGYLTKFILPVDRPLIFTANFTGKLLDTDLGEDLGFYRSFYFDQYSGKKRWYAETQFQATNARRAFPCIDDPKFRTPFVVNVGHPSTLNAFSNSPRESLSDPDENGIVWSRFQRTPPMPTYLVALAVNDFVSTKNTLSPVKIWARKDAISGVKKSLELTPLFMSFLEGWTGKDYVLSKLDQVASRGHHGAMENWGLIIYKERLLSDHPNATTLDTINARLTLAHELAHQWFGNLVTLQSWDFVWLSEGFATFMQYLVVDSVENEWNILDLFPVREIPKAFAEDESDEAKPITHSVETPKDILANFNTLSYSKGATILRMLQHAMGSSSFQMGVQRYLDLMWIGNASPNDLSRALDMQAKLDHSLPGGVIIDRVIKTWTHQAGYPVITVIRNKTSNTVDFIQSRFYKGNAKKSNESWWIPISVATKATYEGSRTRPTLWLAPEEGARLYDVDDSSWILANRDRTGYYRVNYDRENWDQVIEQLRTSPTELSATDAAMLIDDAAALAFSGTIDPDIVVGLLSYLPLERRSQPWIAATNFILEKLSPRFANQLDECFGIYQAWLQKLVGTTYEQFGLPQKPGESIPVRILRLSVVQLAKEANLRSFVSDTSKDIQVDNDSEETYLCSKIRYGPPTAVVEAVSLILSSDPEDDITRMKRIRSLACTQNLEALRLVLSYTVTQSGFSGKEKDDLWNEALKNANGPESALDTLKSYHNQIVTRHDMKFIAARLLSLAKYLSNDYQYISLKKYIAMYTTEEIKEEARFALNVVRKNMQWNVKYRPRWVAAMKSMNLPTPAPPSTSPPTTSPPTTSPPTTSPPTTSPPTTSPPTTSPPTTSPPTTSPPTTSPPTTTPTVPTTSPPASGYRLPGDLVPSHYDIILNTTLEDFTFKGEMSLTVTVVEKTNVIVLHSANLTISKVAVIAVATGEVNPMDSITTDEDKQFLLISVSKSLQPETEVEIRISFSGHLSDDNLGFYKSSYEENNTIKWLAATQFEATYARRAFPCMDEPAYKATFKIAMSRLSHQTTLSNMPIEATSLADSTGHVLDHFAKTPKMSTYLVAFVISEFKAIPISDGPLKVTVWARPALTEAIVAQKVSAELLNYMAESFGQQQPVPKYDFVGLSDFNLGAMENWGIITFREYLLLNDATAGTTVQFKIANIIAHELTHQWFGNLLTVKWWSNLWLQEGMATFMSYVAVDDVLHTSTSKERLSTDEFAAGLEADSTQLSSALNSDAATPEEIASRADAITYKKGSIVWNMLLSVMGKEKFREGLRQYVRSNLYKSVEPSNLASALSVVQSDLGDGLTAGELISSWADQPGYPVVNAFTNSSDGTIIISQEGKRLLYHTPMKNLEDQKWIIPVFLSTSGSAGTLVTVLRPSDSQKIVPITEQGLLLINANRQAPIRVNYDVRKWLGISSALEVKETRELLSPVSRAALFDDALWLARTNRLDITLALNLLPGYQFEDSTSVWQAVRRSLRNLEALLRNSPAGNLFSKFLANEIIGKQFSSLGWSHHPNDDIEERLKRTVVASWACSLKIKPCISHAINDYKLWLQKGEKSVHRDTLPSAICQGLSNDSSMFVEVLASLFDTRKEDYELRAAIIYGLGCTSDDAFRKKYINDVLTLNGFLSSDVVSAVDSLIRNGYLDNVLEEVLANIEKISASLGVGDKESLITSLSDHIVTEPHYEKLKKIVGDSNVSDKIKIALMVASDNVKSHESVHQAVEAWISSHGPPTQPPPQLRTPPLASPNDTYKLPKGIMPTHYQV